MKKNYLIAILALVVNFVNAQIEPTAYRGAFAPAPTAMWTDTWTNFDPKNEPYTDAATVVNVTTDITVNTTWTTGKTYKLTGLIYVRNNAVLTIQPGVIVKGLSTGNGTALIVTKGSKLNAIGTAANPIVFTSGKTVAEGRQPGDWGGIILLGKAGFNVNNGLNNIEGITSNVNTEYGGGLTPDDNDNSGTLKYVRIEFGGYVFSPNNEINGLTMGAVGRGTSIDYVQVSYTNDDAFEWFGGSVNCKHLVSYRNLDDDFDTDNGYKGIVQFGLIVRDPSIADNPSVSTSESFESDNNAAGTASASGLDTTSAIFTNITSVGPSFRATLSPTTAVAAGHERALRLRRATQLKVYNSIFMDFKNSFLFVDGTLAVGNANANTLKFKNNIMAGNVGTFTGGVNPTSLNTWFSSNGNTTQASSAGLLALPYNATTNTYLGLDYRPTGAATGADFSDASLTPFITAVVGTTPVPTNATYCKGALATPLTATLTTTGVSLRWYTVATGGTFTTTAPTPLTTTVGVKNYYVSQVDGSNIESTRVLLTVTTNALPTEVLGAITGVGPVGSTSVTAIGPYVGTTSQFVYSIPAFVDPLLTYSWTVPLGVNIVSGQGTNAITVNFANVAFGAGAVGSIQVQAENASGCKTLAKTLALTKALPAAPTAINMYDTASATPATALTTYAKYMGSTTPLTLTATPVVGVTTYEWELPAGVTISIPAGTPAPVTTTVNYTSQPFFSPSTGSLPTGTRFWTVTNNTYTINVNAVPTTITVSTCAQRYQGGGAYPSTTAPYLQYGTVVRSNLNSILVNFAGVTNPATTALYFGVRSLNGVGYSVTPNGTNADVVANLTGIPGLFNTTYTTTETLITPPNIQGTTTYVASGFAPKTSKLKKLTAAIPAAPTALKLTNDAISTTLGVTVVTTYIGTTTPLTLTAAASATASSYSWELPAGVNQISGGNSNVITINFADVASGVTSMYIGVKAVNGIGSSITATNGTLVPATTSTAKLLKVTAGLPAAPTTLVLTNPAVSTTGLTNAGLYLGTTTPLTLTAAASALATSYSWELPAGVTQLSGGNSRIITVDLAGVAPGTSVMYFGVKAVNAVGSSVTSNATAVPATTSTAKLLKITNTAPAAVTVVTGTITAINCATTYNYTMTASALATSYVITAPTGSIVTSASNLTNTSNVLATSDLTFSVVYPSNLASLTAKTVVISSVNGFGASTTNKTLTVAPATIAALGVATTGGTTFTRCTTKTISFPAIVNATNYTWTVNDGAVIVSGQGTNSIVVDFALVPLASATNVISVFASNACGINTATKTVSLTSASCVAPKINTTIDEVASFSNTSMYPNPATYDFNIDIDASNAGEVQMSIYSINGVLILDSKKITLEQGRNTINENISNLTPGLYIVRLVDSSNKEVMVKKLVKN
ncbi:MAG: T9SS type A sorting domain-containing protein [Flavobacterium sp.]